MSAFDQKPRFYSRPLEWLFTGGRGGQASSDRFFRLLREVFNSSEPRQLEQGSISRRLLALRDEFRRVIESPQSVGALQTCRNDINPLIRAIAIWLLSKHANRFLLLGIEHARDDYSPMVRKRVARALRKLEARQLLLEMAKDYPEDEAIRWYSTLTTNPKSYQDRLENYVKASEPRVSQPIEGPSRMPLWFRDEYWSGSPPKSVEYMRAILRRIQVLVRG